MGGMRAQVWQTAAGRWNYDLGVGYWSNAEGFRVIIDGQRYYPSQVLALAAACEALREITKIKERR